MQFLRYLHAQLRKSCYAGGDSVSVSTKAAGTHNRHTHTHASTLADRPKIDTNGNMAGQQTYVYVCKQGLDLGLFV